MWALDEALMNRVEELEDKLKIHHINYNEYCDLEKERDELRTELAAVQDHADSYVAETKALREKLEAAQDLIDKLSDDNIKVHGQLARANAEIEMYVGPKQPTIVKQTWQIVWLDGTFSLESVYPPDTFRQGVTIIRRNHMSDGTVKCELESINV